MSVIAYDRPVRDLVDALSATGHVTHTAYRKTSVTFHHNGGRLSHDGVLSVWKTRPASAHFDSDANGAIAQYVKVNEYAWATGNTQGNQSSISIEMCNSTLAPNWEVAEATWKSAARLAGWLFAKVIGTRPTRDNVHVHHDWKSTTCAGPYIDKVYNQLLVEVQAAYIYFTGNTAPPPPPPAPKPIEQITLEQVAREVIAGHYGNGIERAARLAAAGWVPEAVQAEVNRQLGAGAPPPPPPPPPPARESVAQIATEVIAGKWGNGPDRSARLAAAGYNAGEVQDEVNRRLGGHQSFRPDIGVLAQQVIAGQWGNGVERERRLTAAGYDARAVQDEVNRRLR